MSASNRRGRPLTHLPQPSPATRLLFALLLLFSASAPAQDEISRLGRLAAYPGVTGDEKLVAQTVRRLFGSGAVIDNTGSAHVSFGQGSPHTLIVAGLDEPGFVVSGFTEDGCLRVQSLGEDRLARYFLGQPVAVHGRTGVSGVVAAPSVHFKSDRGYSRSGPDQIFVDIGAESRAQAMERVRLLDRVRLRSDAFRIGEDRLAGAWISSRAGAAILVELAARLRAKPPDHQVSLAVVSGQYGDNPGLHRALRRDQPERVIVLRPGGPSQPTIQAVEGWDSALRTDLLSSPAGANFEKGGVARFSFGPFGPRSPWPDAQHSVAVTLGVENAGTPIEVISWSNLGRVAALLSHVVGDAERSDWTSFLARPISGPADGGSHQSHPDLRRLDALVRAHGVSGSEDQAKQVVRELLPKWASSRLITDEKGNLIVVLGDSGPPDAVFIAHLDEIGFRVTSVSADGRAQVESVGGLAEDLFVGHPLQSSRSSYSAIMPRSGSVQALDGRLEVGDTLTPRKRLSELLNHRISARSLDDRIGCLVLLEALRALDANPQGRPVWFVFSVEEETGLHGAAHLAQRTRSKRVYPIDSFVTSDSPLEPKRIAYAPLGSGAVLRAMDNSGSTPRQALDRVVQLARDNDIPLQVGVTAGGNDGSKFTAFGAVNIPLAFPLRYSHTAAETADLRDVRALIRLVQVLLEQELAGLD